MTGGSTMLGIEAGDWLQAVASFLGVGVTILGTLYIERRMRDADTKEDVLRIQEVVTAIADAASDIASGLPDDPTNFEHYAKSLSMQTALKTSLDMYHFVRADTKIKDLKLWRALKILDETLSVHGPVVDNELRLLNSDGHYTKVFKINRDKVMSASVPIGAAAKDVQTAIA